MAANYDEATDFNTQSIILYFHAKHPLLRYGLAMLAAAAAALATLYIQAAFAVSVRGAVVGIEVLGDQLAVPGELPVVAGRPGLLALWWPSEERVLLDVAEAEPPIDAVSDRAGLEVAELRAGVEAVAHGV